METENPTILFDDSSKTFILELFDKDVDKEKFIVEKQDVNKRVLTFETEELKLEKFGGIEIGSEIFIENNFVSLRRLIKLKG